MLRGTNPEENQVPVLAACDRSPFEALTLSEAPSPELKNGVLVLGSRVYWRFPENTS